MQSQSFWKKHANHSDWVSRYIDFELAADLTQFTQTNYGSGCTATVTGAGASLVNASGASDGAQFQWPVAMIQAAAPKVPSIVKASSYEFEIEFVMMASFGNPAQVEFMGFCAASAAITTTPRADSMGIFSPTTVNYWGLDLYTSSVNGALTLPAGTSPPAAQVGVQDTAMHEYAFMITPKTGDAKSCDVKIFLDGDLQAWYGKVETEWMNLTQVLLAPAFAVQNNVTGLTTAQRTSIVRGVGWAFRR
jgi:hypothetical protein